MRQGTAWRAAVAAACICGCASPQGKSAPRAAGDRPAGAVLATIGGGTITERDLEAKISAMPPRARGRFRSVAGKKSLLNQMVELELVGREAEREGIGRDRETIERVEEFKKRLAMEKLREKVFESVKVDGAEVRKEYEKTGDRHKTPKQVKVSQILFSWDAAAPEKTVAAMKRDAADVLARARKGEDFAALAKRYSLDQASAPNGGDIGYASYRTLSPEAYRAAMTLEKAGDISGLVEGKDEVRILKATEVLPEKRRPFEEVSPWLEGTVRSRKQREAWNSYIEGLKKREGVVVYEDRLRDGGQGWAPASPPPTPRAASTPPPQGGRSPAPHAGDGPAPAAPFAAPVSGDL